jgi:hypothetical protein
MLAGPDFRCRCHANGADFVSVQKTDAMDYSMFLQNDAGEIYIVNLIQRGQYFYLTTYDYGVPALVIKRGP